MLEIISQNLKSVNIIESADEVAALAKFKVARVKE